MNRLGILVSSYASTVLSIGTNLLLLPVILSKMDSEEIGIWYILASYGAIITLFEGTLNVSFTRYTSYVRAGISSFSKTGIQIVLKDASINKNLFSNYILSAKIYYFISALLCIILAFFWKDILEEIKYNGDKNLLLIFSIYSVGIIFNLIFGYYIPFLRGFDRITEANKITIANRLTFLSVSILGVLFNFGIIALAIASFFSSITSRLYGLYIWNNIKESYYNHHKIRTKKIIQIFKLISSNIGLLLISAISTYLLQRFSLIYLSDKLTLDFIANFGTTLTIFLTLVALSSVFQNTNSPELSIAYAKKDIKSMLGILGENILTTWSIYTLGVFLIIYMGQDILNLLSSEVSLLSREYLYAMAIIYFLESTLGVFGGFISCSNRLPYVWPVFFASLLNLILLIIFFDYYNLNLWSIFIAHFSSQIIFNYWYWLYNTLVTFKCSMIVLLKIGFKRLKNILKAV